MGYCKFYKQKRQIYLNGIWIDTGEIRKGEFYEGNSFDCGFIAEEWRVSGYMCDDTTKYEQEVKFISNNGQTWTATTETRRGALIERDSLDCGFIAEEWMVTGTMCDNLNKYYQETKYISDDGQTWTATTETRKGGLIEEYSTECLDPRFYKAIFYVSDGKGGIKDIIVYPCDGDTVLRDYPEVESGQSNIYERISVGNCITEVAGDAFYITGVFHLDLPENGNLTKIGARAFSNTSLGYHDDYYIQKIPDTVQIIDHSAFDCVHVCEYHIGSGITSIGHSVFDRSKRANKIYFSGINPPTFGGNIFGAGGSGNVYVPCGSYDAYWPVLSGSAVVNELCFENIFKADYLNGGHYESEDPCSGISTITTATTNPSGYDYAAMTSCEIGLCVNNIDENAFRGFTSLQVVRKTNSHLQTPVEYIGERAFLGCISLIDIDEITSGVTTIGNSAFSGCSSLSSVTIGKTIQYIDSDAFKGCTSLTGITINSERYTPETAQIISIGVGAFDNTNNCPIYVDCNYMYLYEASSEWAPYLNRLQAISGTCFTGKFKGYYQFYDYADLREKEVECNSSTTLVADEIDNGYAMKLKYATVGDCVNSITARFGNNIIRINSIVDGVANIPSGVTSIGEYVFYRCSSITSVTLPENITSISRSLFEGCGIKRLNSDTDGIFILPSGTTSIGDYAFSGNSSLTNIVIPDNVTSFGTGAFASCYNLENIIIPSGLTFIPGRCFENCYSLTSVTIPDNITVLVGNTRGSTGGGAFINCTGLTTVVIGSGITRIWDDVFYNCSSLSSVTIYATTPPQIGYYTFRNTSSNIKFYVPCGCVNAYKSAWSQYSDKIVENRFERWVDNPGEYECSGTTKMHQQKKQYSCDESSTWVDSDPLETRPVLPVIEYQSPDCGYATRVVSGATYCSDYDLYVNMLSQVSTDYGSTWTTTATTPTLVERDSQSCHYMLYDYIETPSSTCYYKINTNYYPDASNTIVIKCRLINSSVDWGAIVGWAGRDGDSNINDAFRFTTVTSSYEFIARRGSTSGVNCRPNRSVNVDYLVTIPLSGSSLSVQNITAGTTDTQCFNGTSYSYPSSSNPMYILGFSSNFTKNAAHIRIYYIQVLDSNGNVVREYKPAKIANEPCFYETINGESIVDTLKSSELILGNPV